MEFEKLQGIIAEVLNVDAEDITMATTFVDDLGADSLDIFQIIMGIEEEFDIEIPQEAAENIVTVGDAVEQIKSASVRSVPAKESSIRRLPICMRQPLIMIKILQRRADSTRPFRIRCITQFMDIRRLS